MKHKFPKGYRKCCACKMRPTKWGDYCEPCLVELSPDLEAEDQEREEQKPGARSTHAASADSAVAGPRTPEDRAA